MQHIRRSPRNVVFGPITYAEHKRLERAARIARAKAKKAKWKLDQQWKYAKKANFKGDRPFKRDIYRGGFRFG